MCMCSEDTDTSEHYLLSCQLYADHRDLIVNKPSVQGQSCDQNQSQKPRLSTVGQA